MSTQNILLVEDDNEIRFVYKLILDRAGYNVVTADNGEEALRLLPEADPRLILLDIFMPIMDGQTFLQHLDSAVLNSVDVIVCSNTSDETVIKTMEKLGAKQVILKSALDPKGLVAIVEPYFS
jgi:CheY-like chemotaxis protein